MAGLNIVAAVHIDQHPVLSPADLARCRPPTGFRFLVAKDMEVVEPVLLFLFDRYARSNKPWDRVVLSQAAACDDLYEWWSYLDLIGLHWSAVMTSDVQGYRVALEHAVSPRTQRRYRTNTIRRRLGTILAFYKWALAQKYIDEVVDRTQVRNAQAPADRDMLAHVGHPATTTASELLPSEEETEPRPFHTVADLTAVLRTLGPMPSERQHDGRPARDRLAAMVALTTGARISEVLNLPLSEVVGARRPHGAAPTAIVVLWLRKTKRMRPRKILMPVWLLDELMAYIETERDDAVRRARLLNRRPSHLLFLNGTSANNRDVGRALQRRSLSRAFWDAVVSAGLYTTVGDDAEVGQTRRRVAKHSFHDLRHTFAVQQYLARKTKGDAEPWKTISVLLGHKSWRTTMDCYLASVSIAEADLSDVMSGYFHSILSLGAVDAA